MIYTLLTLSLLSPSLASDASTKEHSIIEKVDKLTISGGYHVVLSEGKPGITLIGHSDILKTIDIQQHQGCLNISPKTIKPQGWFSAIFGKKHYNTNYGTSIHITLDRLDSLYLNGATTTVIKQDIDIEKISLSGASKLTIKAPISPRQLDISLRGHSFLNAKSIKTNQLQADLTGSAQAVFSDLHIHNYGVIDISGTSALSAIMVDTKQLALEASGRSMYNFNTIHASEVFIDLYGIAQTSINMIKSNVLNTSLRGSSQLKVKQSSIKDYHENTSGMASSQFDAPKA